jgi:hypothetical protein
VPVGISTFRAGIVKSMVTSLPGTRH